MFVHVNWMIKCCWYWIHVSKIICINMLCFCEKWGIMKLWCDELGMNSWLIVVNDVWKHVVDELVWWICLLVIWWWKLLLMWNNHESFGEFLNWNKMMFDSQVLSIHEYVFMYMTYKHHLGRILSVERKVGPINISVWERKKKGCVFRSFCFLNHFCFLNQALLLNKVLLLN